MDLISIIVKALVKRGVDSAGEKLAKKVDEHREKKKGINQDTVSSENVNATVPARPVTKIDKILKFKPIVLFLAILALVGSAVFGNNAYNYRPQRQKVGEYVAKKYGLEETEKGDYVIMTVSSAEPLIYFYSTTTSKTSSNTTLHEVYRVQDNMGHTALYSDTTYNAMMLSVLSDESPMLFMNSIFPVTVTGRVTNIRDEYSSYKNYKQYVTEDQEQLDLIVEGSIPDGVYDYVQSEEDAQNERSWKTLKEICQVVFYISIGLWILLSIVKKIHSNRRKENISDQENDDTDF